MLNIKDRMELKIIKCYEKKNVNGDAINISLNETKICSQLLQTTIYGIRQI